MGNTTEPTSYYRDFNSICIDHLMQRFVELNWREIFSLTSADELLNEFNENVSNLFEEFVPLRRSHQS